MPVSTILQGQDNTGLRLELRVLQYLHIKTKLDPQQGEREAVADSDSARACAEYLLACFFISCKIPLISFRSDPRKWT